MLANTQTQPQRRQAPTQVARAVQQEGAVVSCSLCKLLFCLKCEAGKREIGKAKVWLESFKCMHALIAYEGISWPLSIK